MQTSIAAPPEATIVVYYHAACRDGFAAAWTAHTFLGDTGYIEGDVVAYIPLSHESFGELAGAGLAGKLVYFLDICPPPEVMLTLAGELETRIVVLDHHKTAIEAYASYSMPSNVLNIFDLDRSGAGLAWDYFSWEGDVDSFLSDHRTGGNEPRPWLVDYVQDRDLWRFVLPESRAVNAFSGSLPFDFDAWSATAAMPLGQAIALGQAIQNKTKQYVAEVTKNSLPRQLFQVPAEALMNGPLMLNETDRFLGTRFVPIVNAPQVDISELLEAMMDGNPDAPFVVGWFVKSSPSFKQGMCMCLSFRSRGDCDVSVLAKAYGGGGHRNAAGAQVALGLGWFALGMAPRSYE